MKLMTKAIEKKIPKLYATEDIEEKLAIVKFFNPCGPQTWYAIEYDPETRDCFGYVDMHGNGDKEYKYLGYFNLNELESLNLPFGLKIERDMHFSPTLISEIE